MEALGGYRTLAGRVSGNMRIERENVVGEVFG